VGLAGVAVVGAQASGMSLPALVQGIATPRADGDGFVEPQVLASRDGALNVTLQAMQIEETSDPRLGFNNALPGPTLRFRPGDTVKVAFVNALSQMTNLHVHGLHVSPRDNSDNVFVHVQPGQTFGYEFQIPENHPAGTFWYHPHPHGISSDQVGSGLAGAIIIEGDLDEVPGVAGVKERLLVLQGPFRGPDGQGVTLVNGVSNPKIAIRPGETQRWRIANASANQFIHVKLVGHPMHVIARDGNPLTATDTVQSELLGPGERAEVLIQGEAAGIYELRSLAWGQDIPTQAQPERLLATVICGGEAQQPQALPTDLLPLEDFSNDELAAKRTIVFQERDGAPQMAIDGRAFVEDRVDTVVKLGTTEEWTIRNESGRWHPFHIHVNDFQLMSVNGEAVPLQRHDTIPLPPRGEIVIRSRFLDFTGRFVYHCHILIHEDSGMMAVIEVVE
jgi:FtsP/CotA-like multicopper oxidase with cupredoxin domain